MVYTVLALVAMVFMGGVIAYNGDVIGRRYGKRRVTFLGMRPRHTAILITSITGVAISALTAGTLFLAVPQVRDIILEGEQAMRERTFLQKEIQAERAAIALMRAQRDKLEGDLADQMVRQKALQASNAQLHVRNRQAEERNSVLRETNGQLAGRNEELAGLNRKLARSNGVLETQNQQKARYNRALQDANEEIGRQNQDLTRQTAALTRARDVLSRSNDELRSQGNQLAEENGKLTQQNTRLTQENDRLLAIVKQLSPGYESLADAYRAVRNGHVVVHGGEDLARCVVPADSSPEEVRHMLDDLVTEAGMAARAKGAGPGQGGRAVRVADKRIWTQATSPQTGSVMVPVDVTAAQRTQAVVDQLSRTPEPTCVLAISVANTVDHEPAVIDFQPYPESLIFTKGGMVGTYRFNSAESADRIFTQLVGFLKALGRDAVSRGAIPHYDPVTGEPQVGSLGAGEIVKLVDRVRAVGAAAQVTALAAKDISTSSALELEFEIVPAS